MHFFKTNTKSKHFFLQTIKGCQREATKSIPVEHRIISKDEDESSVNSFSDEQSSDAETNQESLLNIKTLKVD